jgi:hypothetical protein
VEESALFRGHLGEWQGTPLSNVLVFMTLKMGSTVLTKCTRFLIFFRCLIVAMFFKILFPAGSILGRIRFPENRYWQLICLFFSIVIIFAYM